MAHTKSGLQLRQKRFRYDVALSFAEEDRAFVHNVARYLRLHNVRFFYDDDERVKNWGKDLDPYLDKVYRMEATYCVVFISKYYKEKRWTNHEKASALARAFFSEDGEYLLPFRLDATKIEGISESIVFLAKDEFNEEQLAQAIIDKLELNKTAWSKLKRDIRKVFTPKVRKLGLALAAGGLLSYSLADKFTPVDILTRKLYERNTEVRDSAKCADSTTSHSKGRGTCSNHDGVAYRFKDTVHHKSMEECRREAEAISLFPATPKDNSK